MQYKVRLPPARVGVRAETGSGRAPAVRHGVNAISDQQEAPGVQCQDCSFVNPEGEEFCQACNATLGAVATNVEVTSGRYREIRNAVESLQSGAMPLDAFARWLEQLSATLAQKARGIMDTIEQCNYWQDGAEEIEMGLSGVQSFESGLGELWQFTQDQDPGHLELGLVQIWEGNTRIIEAMRINRESRQALALEWEQLQNY